MFGIISISLFIAAFFGGKDMFTGLVIASGVFAIAGVLNGFLSTFMKLVCKITGVELTDEDIYKKK